MKHGKPPLSLGTVLTLCLTAVVVAGCAVVFGSFRSDNPNAVMSPQRVIGLVSSAVHGPTEEPVPQATVRTVTVTLAPATQVPEASAAAVIASTPAPAAAATYQSSVFSLTAGGLLAFQSEVSDAVYDRTEKTIDYTAIVAPLRPYISADINLVMFPQTINAADHKYGDTQTLPEAADAVRAMGMEQVIVGTEHILDQNRTGAEDTVSVLSERGLACTGVNAGDVSQHRLIQVNGCTVAILSYTDVLTAKGRNAQKADPTSLEVFDPGTARRDIRWARSQGAQCVIVCLYWGRADATNLTASQRNTARALAEMGADVILGSRPTRVLPMETFTCMGEDGRMREAFVAYSLGTLLTESREGYDISGVLLHLDISCDSYGTVRVTRAEYTPTYIWRQAMNNKTQYRLVCSADPAPQGMSDQQKQVMQRALNRIQTTLKGSPVNQR